MRQIMLFMMFMLLIMFSSIGLSTQHAFAATRSVISTHGSNALHPLATAVTCTGDGCDNMDPVASGCDDSTASTVQEVNITGAPNTPDAGTIGDLELRFSPTCGTNWTRFTTFGSNVKGLATIERLLQPNITYLKFCQPVPCFAASNVPTSAPFLTTMVYAPNTPANACGTVVSMTTRRTYKACVQL